MNAIEEATHSRTLQQAIDFLDQLSRGEAALVSNPDPNFLGLVRVQSNHLRKRLSYSLMALMEDDISESVLQDQLVTARSILALQQDNQEIQA